MNHNLQKGASLISVMIFSAILLLIILVIGSYLNNSLALTSKVQANLNQKRSIQNLSRLLIHEATCDQILGGIKLPTSGDLKINTLKLSNTGESFEYSLHVLACDSKTECDFEIDIYNNKIKTPYKIKPIESVLDEEGNIKKCKIK